MTISRFRPLLLGTFIFALLANSACFDEPPQNSGASTADSDSTGETEAGMANDTETGDSAAGDGDGDTCPDGTQGCPCYGNGSCDAELECVAGLCEEAPGDGDGDGDPLSPNPFTLESWALPTFGSCTVDDEQPHHYNCSTGGTTGYVHILLIAPLDTPHLEPNACGFEVAIIEGNPSMATTAFTMSCGMWPGPEGVGDVLACQPPPPYIGVSFGQGAGTLEVRGACVFPGHEPIVLPPLIAKVW